MTSERGMSKKYSEIDVTPYPFIFHGEIIFSHVTRSGPILARQISDLGYNIIYYNIIINIQGICSCRMYINNSIINHCTIFWFKCP